MDHPTIEIDGTTYYKTRITAQVKNVSFTDLANVSQYSETDIERAIASFSEALGTDFGRNPDSAYLQAIYVSSGMNKNDDVFLPSELAKSFGSARLKPLDIDHMIEEGAALTEVVDNFPHLNFNQGLNTVIGVLYDSALLNTQSGTVITAGTAHETLGAEWQSIMAADEQMVADHALHFETSRYDVLTAGILWKWLFPKTVSQIVEDIQMGDRALSMEAYFRDWDWLVEGRIQTKKEAPYLESAFRQGGFNGQRVGRVLRGILFGGAGIVRKPANPAALDFSEVSAQDKKSAVFVSSASLQKLEDKDDPNRSSVGEREGKKTADNDQQVKPDTTQSEENKMPDFDIKELMSKLDEVSEAKAQVTILTSEKTALASQIETLKAENEALKASAQTTQKELDEVKTQLQTASETVETQKTEIETLKSEAEEKDNQIKTAEERAQAAEDQNEVYKQAEVIASRVAKLEESEVLLDATKDAEAVASMSDEDFDKFCNDRVAMKEAIASKASEGTQKKNDGEEGDEENTTSASEKTVVFPVTPEGMTDMHRSLAALTQSDPAKGEKLGKYAKL